MSYLKRVAEDMVGIYKVMPPNQAIRWYANVALAAPSVLKSKKYYDADNAMHGPVKFRWLDMEFTFDLSDAQPQTFSWLREFFVRDNYFKAFRMNDARVATFVDLGCNIGRVAQIIRMVAGEGVNILAIDADNYSDNLHRRRIAQENPEIKFIQALVRSRSRASGFNEKLYGEITQRYGKAFNSNNRSITGHEVVAFFGGKKIDFLKLDIEGAEFDVLLNENEWLRLVDNITMEVHPQMGDPGVIVQELSNLGFAVDWKGNHVDEVEVGAADFIYASRRGLLVSPRSL